MSRPSTAQSRSLTLTEELEKLEQSITLTLQEIDHNFSRAHRIVTGSIIPIVQQYAKHSDSVWEGSKFWKQFFEASANVSLSSYEEAADQDLTVTDATEATVDSDDYASPSSNLDDTAKLSSQFDDDLADSLLDSPSMTAAQHDTPRAKQPQQPPRSNLPPTDAAEHEEASFADYSSPYETLKEEMDRGKSASHANEPVTPGQASAQTIDASGYQSSPAIPLSTAQQSRLRQHNNDPLLHRVLDKTYRIGTTPHTTRKKPLSTSQATQEPAAQTKQSTSTRPSALDSSPFSPAIPAPELRAEIFGSPSKNAPRTPGVSIQRNKTPVRANYDASRQNPFTAQAQRDLAQPAGMQPSTWNDKLWDSDSDTNEDFGMSPPKTMQFHVPQSRLMQTPAKEASKRIVEDLLMTAGAASATSTLDELDLGDNYDYDRHGGGRGGLQYDDSPSIVRMVPRDQDGEDF